MIKISPRTYKGSSCLFDLQFQRFFFFFGFVDSLNLGYIGFLGDCGGSNTSWLREQMTKAIHLIADMKQGMGMNRGLI